MMIRLALLCGLVALLPGCVEAVTALGSILGENIVPDLYHAVAGGTAAPTDPEHPGQPSR